MAQNNFLKFSAVINIIGVNPYVLILKNILAKLFIQSGTNKGKIPIVMKIDGYEFTQTLVKYSGAWRLYLNTPMRKAAGKETGSKASFEIKFNPNKKELPLHKALKTAFRLNPEAYKIFKALPPSRRLEINRYISNLKSDESVKRNVARAIGFLNGNTRFIGRDKP